MIDRTAGRAGLILQARMGSTRLPGKTLMPLAGAPLLQRILERVRRCTGVDVIIVATTSKPQDDPVAALARANDVEVFRGSENDLVDRYLRAAEAFDVDIIARLPADNPVPEPAEIDRIVDFHRGNTAAFSSNLAEVFGSGYPDGLGAEVFDRVTLGEVARSAHDPQDREHPHRNFFDYATQTPRDPKRFPVATVQCPAEFRRPGLILDVNTKKEYDFIAQLYADLYPANPRFHITDIIRWYDEVWLTRAKRTARRPDVSERKVYWNGEFVPEHEARISIYDSALMFGDMVFEMTRSFNQKQFKMRAHLERLYASMKMVRIPVTMTIEEMERAVQKTIEANAAAFRPDDEHRVLIDVSRGLLGIYQGVVGLRPGPNVIIATFPLRWTVQGMGRLFDVGINAVVPSQRAIPASLLDPKIKNRSRLFYQMANIEVSGHEGDRNWALLLDPDGFVAEGTGDNFFIVKNGAVISPEGRNILRGISRAYVMEELCPQLRIPVFERNIDVYDVMTADEAFMTGTPFSILPVTSINHVAIGDGKPGAITKRLIDTWGSNVGVDIAEQIKAWNVESAASTDGAPTPYAFRRK